MSKGHMQVRRFKCVFILRFRALSKVSSVGTILPPDQMCNSMKGSLIKKQVCLMPHVNKSTICLPPRSLPLAQSRSWNRLDAPNSGFISTIIIFDQMAESSAKCLEKTQPKYLIQRSPHSLTAPGTGETAIKRGRAASKKFSSDLFTGPKVPIF